LTYQLPIEGTFKSLTAEDNTPARHQRRTGSLNRRSVMRSKRSWRPSGDRRKVRCSCWMLVFGRVCVFLCDM
jgi:hypothetical protein